MKSRKQNRRRTFDLKAKYRSPVQHNDMIRYYKWYASPAYIRWLRFEYLKATAMNIKIDINRHSKEIGRQYKS